MTRVTTRYNEPAKRRPNYFASHLCTFYLFRSSELLSCVRYGKALSQLASVLAERDVFCVVIQQNSSSFIELFDDIFSSPPFSRAIVVLSHSVYEQFDCLRSLFIMTAPLLCAVSSGMGTQRGEGTRAHLFDRLNISFFSTG